MASVENVGVTEKKKPSEDIQNVEDAGAGMDNDEDGPPKKRRRTAKPNAEKKFECKHEGCGKSYSRAEHLYRHQLNHSPKQIYRCDFPDCNRYFVRQDLCVRHRERHTTHGSQLHKRDSFAQSSTTQSTGVEANGEALNDKSTGSPTGNTSPAQVQEADNEVKTAPTAVHQSRLSSIPLSPTNNEAFILPNSSSFGRPELPLHRPSSYVGSPLSPEHSSHDNIWVDTRPRSHFAHGRSSSLYGQTTFVPHSPVRSYSNSSSVSHLGGFKPRSTSFARNIDSTPYLSHTSLTTSNHMSHPFRSPELPHQNSDIFANTIAERLTSSATDQFQYPDVNTSSSNIDVNTGQGYPIFGGDDFNRSPFALADDFTAWLFSEGQSSSAGFSPRKLLNGYGENPVSYFQGPMFSQSPTTSIPTQNNMMVSTPTNLTNLLDHKLPSGYIMSDSKRQELLGIMHTQFIERPHDAVKKRKQAIFAGDVNGEGHILSLRMMHTYIGSYWYHQHAQLPILHKPTFAADNTPNLLLLAVLAIGAATLDKAYGSVLTDSAAEFANFLVWHLRWEIVRDEDFRPPAKLWVFQTLLLIEVYEKMYSTRALHERAHIHHDSTLTLMRRGSSLIGRSASDSPPNGPEDLANSSISHNPENASKAEEPWARWVAAEATRRVAFGAFVLDSIHCTMFGHSAKMVAHEMRLPLPCDEGLWSATSPVEVSRVQSALQTNGIKPIMFLDGLKRTLSGQRVRTNSFGRTIIMAGLLSVSWHMTQRDLQISSLGPRTASSFGEGKNWKGVLLRAFDNWKRDFDEALAESAATPSSPARFASAPSLRNLIRPVDDENIFESRTVLHHLAHIAAHVDIVDCQVFAGANRLLSRSVTPKDFAQIRDKIEKWATKASARDSAFYALKFIAQVLILPDPDDPNSIDSRIHGHASPILPQAFERNVYIARDDYLLNRPWVLYVSSLVVWCYGYALEGAISPPPQDEDFATHEQQESDMKEYLSRVAGVDAPDDLESIKGKNKCLGLLLILKESFASTRWELMHEAADLLGNAAAKLMGKDKLSVVLQK